MDELKNIQADTSYISEHSFDFIEEANFVVSCIDEDFNALIEKCGAGSDAAPEVDTEGKGEDVTTESAEVMNESKIADIKEGVIKALKSAWEKIKGAFADVLKKINGRIAEAKQKKLDKLSDKFDSKTFKDDEVIGKIYISNNIGSTAWINALKECALKGENDSQQLIASDPASVPKKIANKAFGIDHKENIDIKTLRNDAKSFFLGGEDKPTVITGKIFAEKKGDIIDILDGANIPHIKKIYNEVRKAINEEIAKVKKASKDKSQYPINAKDQNIKRLNSGKRYAQLLTTITFIQFGCVFQQYSQAFAIAMKVKYKIEKKSKKDDADDNKEDETKATSEAAIFAW